MYQKVVDLMLFKTIRNIDVKKAEVFQINHWNYNICVLCL